EFKNAKILLVDDVVTTGSTLNEIAKLLKKTGAKEVWAATLAAG
ncbi:MAG TPA: phosphoribosyltransferase family protein, partial [Patescibacteria group bacterium]|nr:phosphoribosyltransferase family protein [Patescibacteria group bacterium]